MMKLSLAVSMATACLVCGCGVARICPPVQGTVLDERTGAPVAGIRVDILYPPKRTSENAQYFAPDGSVRTDAEGNFSFPAKYKVFPLLPLDLTVVSGAWLEVKAAGNRPKFIAIRGYISPKSPPHRHPMYAPSEKTVGFYDGKALVVDPIRISPPAVKPAPATQGVMFMGLSEDKAEHFPPSSALHEIEKIGKVKIRLYADYINARRRGRIYKEMVSDGWQYWAMENSLDVPFPNGTSAMVNVVERFKSVIPAGATSSSGSMLRP